MAGVTTRHIDLSTCLAQLRGSSFVVQAEQVHGASLAVVEHAHPSPQPILGCDALLTSRSGLVLVARSADCLPILFADPVRAVIGVAHAGWRGLVAQLPCRMVSALQRYFGSSPDMLRVVIGPAIHACCYDVGPEFVASFGPFVQERGGRRTCDLIGVALRQLQRCGVRTAHMIDVGHCTACEGDQWYSLRKEGAQTGRLRSFIALVP